STAVQQTEAQYLDAKSMLIDLKNQARLLENVMSLLMGEEPHSIERSELDQQNITTELKVGVPIELLSNRPDVIMAENNYRQAFEMKNVARANFYPSFTIGAAGGIESLKLDNWFDANSLFANVLGGITAPIFNGRQIRTQFEVSQIQQEQARLDYRGVLLVATKEVSDALFNYESASEKIEIKKDQRELLEQAVEDSQALLESGYNNFSYLEVLTAQESVLNSSLDVINAELSQLISMIDLYEALGGGWK
ncbi:MAG TPA: TolC family protein, partial [Flavobacteriaceae bacterium]|nr:TolC family protein [Flavobacteriaceae bacterium]